MAMACFGFVTFLPLLPLFSLPRLNSCISRSTLFCALGLYLRPRLDDFFLDELPEDFEPDGLRWERLELLFFADAELRGERDDLLPLFFAAALDLLRDELFLRAVGMRSSLLHYSDAGRVR